jgi:hypothetical protein
LTGKKVFCGFFLRRCFCFMTFHHIVRGFETGKAVVLFCLGLGEKNQGLGLRICFFKGRIWAVGSHGVFVFVRLLSVHPSFFRPVCCPGVASRRGVSWICLVQDEHPPRLG